MNYSIKKLTEADLPESAGLIRESFGTVAREFNLTVDNCPSNGAFINEIRLMEDFGRGVEMFGLFEAETGAQIGFMALEGKPGGVHYLEKLAIRPSRRHRGGGRKLLDFAVDHIRLRGGVQISIGIIYENKRLLGWYEALGFRQTGIKKFDHLPFSVCFLNYEV